MPRRAHSSSCTALARCERGVTMVEFALVVPLLLAMFMGSVEVTRFILLNQKLSKTADTMADIATQGTTISRTEIDQMVAATQDLMVPYTFGVTDAVVFTSVQKTGTNPSTVAWQYPDPASKGKTSRVGSTGGNATISSSIIMQDKDNVIVAEVFYSYTPLLPLSVVPAQLIYKSAIFKPRLGTLTTLN